MSSGDNFVGNKDIAEKVCEELFSVRLDQERALLWVCNYWDYYL
jgi:hypothetical protein